MQFVRRDIYTAAGAGARLIALGCAWALGTLALAAPSGAFADAVVALPTHAEDGDDHPAIDRALRKALAARSDVELAPQPALDLEAVQLAIDCVGDSPRCLNQVAERTQADVLLAPTVERSGEQVELRILYYDARQGRRRYAARREPGRAPTQSTLQAIPGMVDELFDGQAAIAASPEPARPGEQQAPPASSPADAAADETPPGPQDGEAPAGEERAGELGDPAVGQTRDRQVPTGALLLGGGGLLVVAGGVVAGLMLRQTQDDYDALRVRTMADAQEAEELRQRGQREAVVASALLGVGAAAVVASGVWLALELGETERRTVALVPHIGSDRAGLTLTGRWEGM